MTGFPWFRRLFGLALTMALLGLAAFALKGGFAFDVRMSEAQLNLLVGQGLPLERKSGPVHWRILSAKLNALDRGRVALDARVRATVGAVEAGAHVAGSAVLAYREAAFWLADIDIDALDDIAVRRGDAAAPGALGKALGGLVARSEGFKRALEGIEDKATAEAMSHAGDVLDAVFRTIPVYRVRDDLKGMAERAVLVSVRTEGKDLVARVDPVGGMLRAVALIVIMLILLYGLLCLLARFTVLLGGLAAWLLFWW